ncbi:MATE family efflux transporter [Methanobrevibacter sp.]|uniref:MATE family efflux transporter n=1 Tax=Methanobrevibacter sp. TaxID=66852 RepID=UPI00388D4FAB
MTKNIDIINNPKNAFWKLSTPIFLLSLFNAFYSMVDLFWVSQMSPEAFFAVGVAHPLFKLITGFGESIGTGTNSIISREIGKKDYKNSYNSILHGIMTCIILGVVLILIIPFLKNILNIMGVTKSIDLAIDYLTPIFIFSFIFLISKLFVSTLQAEGNTRTPTIVLIITNILNLILDPLFIFVFNWGVAGIAYATIISTSISVIYFLYLYLSGKTEVILNLKYFKLGIVYEIFIVAIPNLIMDMLWSFYTMYINRILIAQLGQIGVLLYSTASQIEILITTPHQGFDRSLVTICGQLFGANKIQKLKEIYNYSLKYSLIISLTCTIVFFIIRDYGFALFSVTGVETSVFYIALFGIVIVSAKEVSKISNKMLDGIGKSYHSLILTNSLIIFQIIIIALLSSILTSGVGVLIGITISEVVFSIITYIIAKTILNGDNLMEEKIEIIEEKVVILEEKRK